MPYPTQWADYDPNKFMCSLCFGIFHISECAIDDTNDQKVDVCAPCWEMEQKRPKKKEKL